MGVKTSAGERQEYTIDRIPRKVMNNTVLIRVDFDPSDDVVLPSGIILSGLAGTTWEETDYIARYGVVEAVPDFLKCRPDYEFDSKDSPAHSLEWKTEMELEVGDVCYFTKMASANAQVIFIDQQKHFLINYDEIVVGIRNGVIRPLNGYCLVDKVTEKTRRKGLLLEVGDFHNKRLGVVTHVGTPNAYYHGTDAVDAEVEVGDRVVFEGGFWTALESSMFNTLDENLGFVQRCWINGIL